MDPCFCEIVEGDGPIVATAIHDGHALREEVAVRMALGESDRLREEDPYTGAWTSLAPTRLAVLRSRFEIDLNRPREKSIYLRPEDAWGLAVWNSEPTDGVIRRSLVSYDAFHATVARILSTLVERFGKFVVFDLHSYNHRRSGPDGPLADPTENPQVNIGTGSLDRKRWGAVVDRFISDLRGYDFPGGALDVRENVKFRGGSFPAWIHRKFTGTVCVLSVEVKKFFMDEWMGQADVAQKTAVLRALKSTVWGIYEELVKLEGADQGVPA